MKRLIEIKISVLLDFFNNEYIITEEKINTHQSFYKWLPMVIRRSSWPKFIIIIINFVL